MLNRFFESLPLLQHQIIPGRIFGIFEADYIKILRDWSLGMLSNRWFWIGKASHRAIDRYTHKNLFKLHQTGTTQAEIQHRSKGDITNDQQYRKAKIYVVKVSTILLKVQPCHVSSRQSHHDIGHVKFCFIPFLFTPRHFTSCCLMSFHVIPCHVILLHIISCHSIPCHVMSFHYSILPA